MALRYLTLDSLKALDFGKPDVQFNREMESVIHDLIDRPGEQKARTVGITISVVPVIGDEGQCEGAKVNFKFQHAIPPRQTRDYDMAVNTKGKLIFSETSPSNVDQLTIDDMDAQGHNARELQE